MFDVFIKFSDYSLLVRALVASWIIFTALICIVAMVAKPIKKDLEPAPKQRDSEQQDHVRSRGNGIYVGKDAKGVYIEGATANRNQNNGIYVEQDAEVKLKNTKTNYNQNNGISIETPKQR